MFIVPSRGRPHNLKRLAKACRETGMTAPALVCLDADDPALSDYLNVPLLREWRIRLSSRVPLATLYNDVFEDYYATWYGFIADDVVPETPEWDRRLIEVAGMDGMAVPDGGHDPDGAPHFVLGRKLPDSTGWLALPGLSRLYIDTAWQDIATERGVLRRVPEVVLKHHHFSNRLALYDYVYKKPSREADKALYEAWRANGL